MECSASEVLHLPLIGPFLSVGAVAILGFPDLQVLCLQCALPPVDFLTIGDSDGPGPVRPSNTEERGSKLEAEARTLPEGTAGYTARPLHNHP